MPLLLILAALGMQDPVRVNAALTEDRIEAGQTTILRVEVETDGPRAQIERLTRLPPGIELVTTRDFDQRQFRLPGGTRRYISREFVLRARTAGQYRIPSIDVVVGNQRLGTGSNLLTVTGSAVTPPDGAVAGEGNVMLRAWIDRDTVYVGEQVNLRVEAMFSQEARLRLRRAPEYEAPRPAGFWVQDLPDPRGTGTRRMGNDIFEVQNFRRAFFPLSPGRHEIPPARLTYEMRRGMLYAPESFEVATDPIVVTVLPVPATDRPPSFTGAVGRFTMDARLEPARVTVGEAAVLTVVVEGDGNIKALPAPRPPELDGLEVFPPSEEASQQVTGDRVHGSKTFSWVLIPREAGMLELPEVRYAYWDADTRRFETLEAPLQPLAVLPGEGGTIADAGADAAVRYLKTAPARSDLAGWVRSPLFAGLQAVPLTLLLAALVLRRRAAVTGPGRHALRQRRRAGVRALEERVDDTGDTAFFGDAESFARAWLADALGLTTGRAGSASDLEAAGVDGRTAVELGRMMDRLSAARYAPTPPGGAERRQLLTALAALLERVERGRGTGRGTGRGNGRGTGGGRTRARRRGAGPAAGLVLLVVGTGVVAAQQAPTFAQGLAAFDDGRYHDAARAFDAWIDAHPRDPAGWYNLGTAYHHEEHAGYAVWAWLQALRLDPRDRDTRHNLTVGGAAPELVARVEPPVPLSRAELILLMAAAWWVAGAAGAWWLLWRRTAAAVTAGAALAVVAAAGALWAATGRDARTLVVLEETVLRAGPTLGGDVLTDLRPAAGLVPVTGYGDWRRVRTLDGREGWVENRAVAQL